MKKKNQYDEEWFRKRAMTFLKKREGGFWDYSDSLLLYMDHGEGVYVEAQEKGDYFDLVVQPERKFLTSICSEVVSRLPNLFDYIDLGPGTERKEVSFFKEIKKRGKTCVYIPVDINAHFLSLARGSAMCHGIPVVSIQSSFEETSELIKRRRDARFVSLLGLTFSNYAPEDILQLLSSCVNENGFFFFDVQLRDRIDMLRLRVMYGKYMIPVCQEKIRLLGLDFERDIVNMHVDADLRVWCNVIKTTQELEERGVQIGDALMVFQSVRPTLQTLGEQLQGLKYTLLERKDSSFVAVLVEF